MMTKRRALPNACADRIGARSYLASFQLSESIYRESRCV